MDRIQPHEITIISATEPTRLSVFLHNFGNIFIYGCEDYFVIPHVRDLISHRHLEDPAYAG